MTIFDLWGDNIETDKLLQRCKLFYEMNDYENTIRLCNRILKDDGENETALSLKAMSLFKLGQYSNALEVIDQGLKIYPENTTLKNAKTSVFERRADLTKRLKVISRQLAENDDEDLVKKKLHTLISLEEYGEAYKYFMSLDDYTAECCDYELLASKLSPNLAIDCLNKVVNENIESVDRIKLLFEKLNLDLGLFANKKLE